jgi:hypothetical protein
MPPNFDGEFRKSHAHPEDRLHYSGDVSKLLVSYDRLCRLLNVRAPIDELERRLRDHQPNAAGGADKSAPSDDVLGRLDLRRAAVLGSSRG